jgi:hypothetical protein
MSFFKKRENDSVYNMSRQSPNRNLGKNCFRTAALDAEGNPYSAAHGEADRTLSTLVAIQHKRLSGLESVFPLCTAGVWVKVLWQSRTRIAPSAIP